jgi:hypothetical protein
MYANQPKGVVACAVLSDEEGGSFFPRRQDAVILCHITATLKEQEERDRWELLAAQSEVYPERCSHYLQEIEAISGQAPVVTACVSPMPYRAVGVRGYVCVAGKSHRTCWYVGLTAEETLAQAAEFAYAEQFRCECWQQWPHLWQEEAPRLVRAGGDQ